VNHLNVLSLLINGLVTGAVFAIAASGLVVTYSTSGIFNFAHGALGMFCTYVYWELRVNHSWPAPLALGVVLLVIGPSLGALLYRVVMSGLRDTSEVVRLVVPISVLLGFIGLANWIWKPDVPHTIQPFFGSDHHVSIFGVVLLWHDLAVVAVAIALAAALRLLLYRTRTGISMRAVVDDRSLVSLTGAGPEQVSLVSWMLGVSLAALAGILITPFEGGSLSTTLLTLQVINAFAAAMFGRLRNLPLTFVGAVVLGLATRMAFGRPTGLMPTSFDWAGNLRLAVPAILLFLVLLALPQDRLRGALPHKNRERFSVPKPRPTIVSGIGFLLVIFLLSRIMRPEPLIVVSDAIAAAIIMLSLVVLVGYAGEVSLATMALAAIGGMVLFHHVGHGPSDRAGPGAYAIAMVVTALVGAAIALPALRLRGLYLALATAAFSLAVEQMLFKEFSAQRRIYPATLIVLVILGVVVTIAFGRSRGVRAAGICLVVSGAVIAGAAANPWLERQRWSALFPNGNLSVPRPRVLGIDFNPQANFLLLLSVVFVLVGFLLVALRRSSYGRRLNALKDSPAACATLGMNVVRLKLSVFMLSAAIAGLGGCLFSQEIGAVTADRFNLFQSMSMLMLLVVAGAAYVSGGLAAGLLYGSVFVVLQESFTKLGVDYAAFAGLFAWLSQFTTVLPALIGVSLGRNPSGFLGDAFDSWRRLIGQARIVVAGAAVTEAVIWFLTFRHVVGNWTFAILTGALAVGLPRIGAALTQAESGAEPGSVDEWGDGPLELVGFGGTFTHEDLQHIDSALGLEETSV